MITDAPVAVIDALCCPSCGGELKFSENSSICSSCASEFSRDNGILDLYVEGNFPPLAIYRDPNLEKWKRILADVQDYFYSGGIIKWGQEAGHRHIKKIIKRLKYDFMLDLACGDGAHLPFVDDINRYVGLDVHIPSLKKLKSRFPNAFVFRGNGYLMPFRNQSISCVINIYNLEHMAYLDHTLQETRRVLKRDGCFCASFPCEGGMAVKLLKYFTSHKNFHSHNLDHFRVTAIEHINSVWQIKKAIQRYFKIEQTFFFPFGLPCFHPNVIVTYLLKPCLKYDLDFNYRFRK